MIDARDYSISINTNLDLRQTVQGLKAGLWARGFSIISEVPYRTAEFTDGIALAVWGPSEVSQSVVDDQAAPAFVPLSIVIAEAGDSSVVMVTNSAMYARVWMRMLARELVRSVQQILGSVETLGASAAVPAQQSEVSAATTKLYPACQSGL